MGRRAGCVMEVLAAQRSCRVERCSHGTVHLTIGALTLRLAPENLVELTQTLLTASGELGTPVTVERHDRLLC